MTRKNVEVICYFSSTYNEARKKFLEAAHGSGAQVESIKHPYDGPNGEPLFTDVAVIGTSDAKNVLVLSSGTHGVEGFTGSGIQTGYLCKEITPYLEPDISFLFIHALNPYGFAHLRRLNEDNIDLNYNFSDHSKPHPKNPGYEKLADAIAPKSVSFWSEIVSWSRLLWYMVINGKNRLEEAITGGQYTHSKGLFYGGRFEAWSNRTIREIAHRYLSSKNRVIVIDFHTGLGESGNAEIILNVPEESNIYKRAITIWGPERVKTTVTGKARGIHLTRTLKLAFPKMLPNTEVTAVSLEYGTFSPMEVFKALRLENWLHHYGEENHPNAQKIRAELLKVFYPNTEDWKLQVWQQGKEIIDQALLSINPSQ